MEFLSFGLTLIEAVLANKKLNLKEENIRLYAKGAHSDKGDAEMFESVNAHRYNKLSNIVQGDYLIVSKTSDAGVTAYTGFDLSALYDIYKRNSMNRVVSAVVASIAELGSSASISASVIKERMSNVDNLIICPINYDTHSAMLRDGIYRRIGDIALVVYVDMGNTVTVGENQHAAAMLTSEHIQVFDQSEDVLFDIAMKNTVKRYQPYCCLVDMKTSQVRWAPIAEGLKQKYSPETTMCIGFTNRNKFDGATAMFYPGVADMLWNWVGEDYYIVFTSVNEFHVHAISDDTAEHFRDRLLDVIKSYPNTEAVLTRKLYIYRRSVGFIEEYIE